MSACLILACLVITASVGCQRRTYRLWADDDAYCLIQSRQTQPSWLLPDRPLEPQPQSRLADQYDPDCGPRPPDDPAANDWLNCPYRFHNNKYWDRIAEIPSVENSSWEFSLPFDEQGVLVIDRSRAMELALLHSRDYQTQLEAVYLNALGLSANRFEFDTQWFGGTASVYNGRGRRQFADRRLSQNSVFGFTRSLAGGGELAASLVNSFVWSFRPTGPVAASGSLLLSVTQPLLRGAFRHVRLESLSQAERNLLYEVREFARFRRRFYLEITGTYLNLITRSQSLMNQRANLDSLELSLREFQELYQQGSVSQLQVDQVFQDFQRGRISYLASERAYADSLDAFKLQLGLPPRLDIRIDEKILEPFELSDPKFEELREQTNATYQALVQYLPPDVPPRDLLDQSLATWSRLLEELHALLPGVEAELSRWQAKLDATNVDRLPAEDAIDFEQQKILIQRARAQLLEVKREIASDLAERQTTLSSLAAMPAGDAWKMVSDLIGIRFRSQQSVLFVTQNQVRLFLIDVQPFDIDEATAVDIALGGRLDLMNQRARTMDAWRGVEVAADALESDLDLTADLSVGTDPSFSNPVRFDASESLLRLGVQFDGPLNRFNERNQYRSAQIFYQQARRQYMAAEDGIVTQIRVDLRDLRINWLNFQISRQTLISAARRVDETQLKLRAETSADSASTRDLLEALQVLLDAKNGLISSWINYEVGRIGLFVDLELLYLDSQGTWINEAFNPGLDAQQPDRDPTSQLNDPESTGTRFDENSTSRFSPDGDPERLEAITPTENTLGSFEDYFRQ